MASASALERTTAQRFEALALANGVRSYRARMKREMKAGKRSVAPLLCSPPAEIETMKVLDLLLAAPKVGRVKAMKALGRASIAPSKTVAGLSPRQRSELLALLALR